MRRILLLAVAALSMAWTRAEDVTAPTGDGVIVRSPDHGRTWQVLLEPDEPLRWTWTDKSTTATLTVTSHLGRVSSATCRIERAAGEDTGSWTFEAPAGESLHDMVLTLYAGTRAVETYAARIVVLPKSFNVLPAGSSSWRCVKGGTPRPVPYDAAWQTNALDAFVLSGGGVTMSHALDGTSGFEPLDLYGVLGDWYGPFTAALASGEETVSAAELVRRAYGMMLKFR